MLCLCAEDEIHSNNNRQVRNRYFILIIIYNDISEIALDYLYEQGLGSYFCYKVKVKENANDRSPMATIT